MNLFSLNINKFIMFIRHIIIYQNNNNYHSIKFLNRQHGLIWYAVILIINTPPCIIVDEMWPFRPLQMTVSHSYEWVVSSIFCEVQKASKLAREFDEEMEERGRLLAHILTPAARFVFKIRYRFLHIAHIFMRTNRTRRYTTLYPSGMVQPTWYNCFGDFQWRFVPRNKTNVVNIKASPKWHVLW